MKTLWILFCIVLVMGTVAQARPMKEGEFLVIVYHAVVENPPDEYSVSRKDFVQQMEYLKTHGFNPVSVEDILLASKGKKKLPPKPVLLAFDDGYVSYYEFVVPVLEEYGFPSVVSVIGKYVGKFMKDYAPEPFMNWQQLKELASHRLVEISSHTFDLHKAVQYNSVGNVGPALYVRRYDTVAKRYETEEEYIKRLERDFEQQERLFQEKLGFKPRTIVWPFGKYTRLSKEIAIKRGYEICFTSFNGYASLDTLYEVKRNFVMNEPMEEFIEMVNQSSKYKPYIRAVQVDLDLIYDPESYEKTDQNLGRLIDRLVEMKVNAVFLQAFSDPEGTGNIKSVYFPNRVLPMKADLFSHAVHQIKIRDMDVYAWMPVLSIELPDEELNKSLKVVSVPEDKKSWYNRLSPFSKKARELIKMLYEDLAAHSLIQGVLFQDDAYLTDFEDFHPEAIKKYREVFGEDFDAEKVRSDPELMKRWTRLKTETLIDLTEELKEAVRKYRPETFFARNIYAPLLTNPESEEWFAQSYELFLDSYDYVVVMAYPVMEGIDKPSKWLEELVSVSKQYKDGVKKTVFKLQSYDWQSEKWINDWKLLTQLRDVLASGGRNLAYYPDNFWVDKPSLKIIRLEMSTQSYPFLP